MLNKGGGARRGGKRQGGIRQGGTRRGRSDSVKAIAKKITSAGRRKNRVDLDVHAREAVEREAARRRQAELLEERRRQNLGAKRVPPGWFRHLRRGGIRRGGTRRGGTRRGGTSRGGTRRGGTRRGGTRRGGSVNWIQNAVERQSFADGVPLDSVVPPTFVGPPANIMSDNINNWWNKQTPEYREEYEWDWWIKRDQAIEEWRNTMSLAQHNANLINEGAFGGGPRDIWELHRNAENGSLFYHNPTSGVSQYEPPFSELVDAPDIAFINPYPGQQDGPHRTDN